MTKNSYSHQHKGRQPNFRSSKNANKSNIAAENAQLVLFNKPYNTLCQFRGEESDTTLANWINIPDVYPAGRLDKDSEGLLLLTNDGRLQHLISHPKFKQGKTYWVQVEGEISSEAIDQLCTGVRLKDGLTGRAKCQKITEQALLGRLWPREPAVRYRANIPTSWIELTIKEGKNRQVRRMTAAAGYPTLRLIRAAIGHYRLGELKPGEHLLLQGKEIQWPGYR